jgi:hypothetical protein
MKQHMNFLFKNSTRATRIPRFLDGITQLINEYNVQIIDG